MASMISVLVRGSGDQADEALRLVDDTFSRYERACSRFDHESELNVYLRRSEASELSTQLSEVIVESFEAYVRTGGRFDPRIRQSLEALGYNATYSALVEPRVAPTPRPQTEPWLNPVADLDRRRFHHQTLPLDFGGIAKGVALRAAARALEAKGINALIAAGGDVATAGVAPSPWPIAIEDPVPGSHDPVATIALTRGSVMTSSVRVRQWRAGSTPVHHLIDPRTGLPGGNGLASVTVLGVDPVLSEVWSKSLFLGGLSDGLLEATARDLAAIFVSREGEIACSPASERFVTWVRPS